MVKILQRDAEAEHGLKQIFQQYASETSCLRLWNDQSSLLHVFSVS